MGTLRDAINQANANSGADTISFDSSVTGTIRLQTGQLSITDSAGLTINGPGASALAISGDKLDDGPSADDSRIFDITSGAKATISGLTLTEGNGTDNGGSPEAGGGVIVEMGSTLSLADSVVTGNATTSANGGGIFNAGSLTVTGSTVSNNTAGNGSGGGISNNGSATPLVLEDSIVSGNTAVSGGGVDLASTVIVVSTAKYSAEALSIESTTISGNHASADGGGIGVRSLNPHDVVTVSNSTISGNDASATGYGGGIGIGSASSAVNGEFDVVQSTISGNTAGTGAGVSIGTAATTPTFGSGGSFSAEESTIAGNQAALTGGGLFLSSYDSGSPAVKSSPTVALTSTIVADNTAAGNNQDLDREDDSTTGGFDLSYSLIEAKGDAPVTESPAGSNIFGSDPKLGALANNGGTTKTLLPDGTSPVVDHGKAPARLTTDQRGDDRVVDGDPGNAEGGDGSDIGAVEVQDPPVIPVTPPADSTPTNNNTQLPPSNQPSNQAPNLAPKTTIDTIALDVTRSRKRRVTGTATDDKRVAFVEIAIVQKKSKQCRELRANGTFTKARTCGVPKTFIVAQGTSKWSFPLLQKLPKGSYTLYARSVDDAGRYEVTYSSANQRDFKIK